MPEEDPLRARSSVAFRAFSFYLRWYFSRNFHAVRVSRAGVPSIPAGRPLIVCSNHPSWWDPAMFIILVNKLLPDRIGFGPMESDALARYGIMRKMGVFGIDSQSRRGAEKFLRTGVQILSDPRSVLFVTAEGMFVDPRHRPIRLRGGVAHLTKRVPNAVILPLALEYTFWNERKPEALAHFGQPLDSSTSASIADCIRHLEEHLTDAVETLAAASMTRDPGLFHELLRGRSGIGGVYDVWRHGAALLQGERFSASHEERG